MERLSGALDVSVPTDALVARLASEPNIKFDTLAVLDAVGRASGWMRLIAEKHSSPGEIVAEATALRSKTMELWTAVDRMHPSARAFVREYAREMPETAVRALVRLQAALDLAIAEMQSAMKPGPSSLGQRNRSLTLVYQALRKHSVPAMGKEAARALASDLLALALPDRAWPSDRDELRKITG